MRTAVREELSSSWPTWVTGDCRTCGFLGRVSTSGISRLLCTVIFFLIDLSAVATDLIALLCVFVLLAVVSDSPLLGLWFLVTVCTCTWSVPASKRAYEGLELIYLGRVKPVSGFTQTSSSKEPPECRSGMRCPGLPSTRMALPSLRVVNRTS